MEARDGPPGRLKRTHKASQSAQIENRCGKRMKEAICFGRCMEMCTYDFCIALLCRNLFIILTFVIYTIYVIFRFICYIYIFTPS